MEQSSILSAKFDCPVAHQVISLLATAHDWDWLTRTGAKTKNKKQKRFVRL